MVIILWVIFLKRSTIWDNIILTIIEGATMCVKIMYTRTGIRTEWSKCSNLALPTWHFQNIKLANHTCELVQHTCDIMVTSSARDLRSAEYKVYARSMHYVLGRILSTFNSPTSISKPKNQHSTLHLPSANQRAIASRFPEFRFGWMTKTTSEPKKNSWCRKMIQFQQIQ